MATHTITKVWVRRPNSSPTRIQIPSVPTIPAAMLSPGSAALSPEAPRHVDFLDLTDDFLVDDLREAILTKFPQSLGKHHDATDLSIRIPGKTTLEGEMADGDVGGRFLSPDESVLRILRDEYPNGQRSSEAWTIITTGGRDNYTRLWLQTGGIIEPALRSGVSPNQISTGGSEPLHQEYFPYIPQTVVTPPGEYPPRTRTSGANQVSYSRSQQGGRPSLRPNRGTAQDVIYQGRRYDNSNSSSMPVEPASQAESEISRAQGRGSPDSSMVPNLRYPPNIRPQSSISGRNTTPPGEYPPNRLRQYPPGAKGPTSVPNQGFQMQLPPNQIIPQKVPSPSSGVPPNLHPQQRLSTSSSGRPKIPISTASPAVPTEKPNPQPTAPMTLKPGTTSPKSPTSGTSSGSGTGSVVASTSPVSRRKSNTLTGGQPPPILTKPRSPSPVAEQNDSPRPTRGLPIMKFKVEKEGTLAPLAPKGSVLGVIPPISVLIVEDNIINAQILEAFFRKRKLKYATAVNGKQAVEKWRQGGWHLVLMDIQLPVMSGIEATKEIRRLERLNHIGVFTEETTDKPSPEDELGDLPFPSPVIIVALTASSRDTDRNEALAAGCNDFLTKPVGAPWLERKAIEWGCMQALIWTAFERKRRRAEEGEVVVEDGGGVDEKPSVRREDSGESVATKESVESSEEAAMST